MVARPADGDYAAAMAAAFKREFGFALGAERRLLVDDVRVRAVGATAMLQRRPISAAPTAGTAAPPPRRDSACLLRRDGVGVEAAPVHVLSDLLAGHAVAGPAIVMNGTSTCVVEPGATAHVTEEGDLRIELHDDDDAAAAAATDGGSDAAARVACDPITLSVFSNRFMSIAEQMGRTLQRTATSVNIKERLDFSCALFGGDGGLVANAPHVPVHLGAMADTVRAQVAKLEGTLAPGDVIAANHPAAGGSHLPDITVITPVFAEGAAAAAGQRPLFYCASRGHHADVGGRRRGRCPRIQRRWPRRARSSTRSSS